MKNYFIYTALLMTLGCASSVSKTENRSPNQVTGDFGKSRMFVRYNILTEVRKKNSTKLLRTQSEQVSPCPMGFMDLVYNPNQNSGGSCTGYTFSGLKGNELSGSRLGIKVNVTRDQGAFNSELIVGSGDIAYTVVKRLEDTVNLENPFYQRFDGKINLGTREDSGQVYNYILESVEIANSHYYEAGANSKGFEEVNFSKIADDYVNSRGGLENLIKEERAKNSAQLYDLTKKESKELNKRLRSLKSMKKNLTPEQYQQLKEAYLSLQDDLDKNWDSIIKDFPSIESKRIKFIELD